MSTTTQYQYEGKVIVPNTPDYEFLRKQYATTSHAPDLMSPLKIIYALGDNDVILAIKECQDNNYKMAIRTGGHQYSGLSSCDNKCIQLDLSKTYQKFNYNKENNVLTCGVSHTLEFVYTELHKLGLFLPAGVCPAVNLGGHVQSGGYGNFTRSFGLLADYVKSFDIILASGKKETIKRSEKNKFSNKNDELFWAVLGGNPGNFGVITEYKFTPLKNKNYANAVGYYCAWSYTKEKLATILKILEKRTKSAEQNQLKEDIDLMITIASTGESSSNEQKSSIFKHIHELIHNNTEISQKNALPEAVIVFEGVYANEKGLEEKFKGSIKEIFDEIVNCIPRTGMDQFFPNYCMENVNLSLLLYKFYGLHKPREFDYPYVKRVRFTKSTKNWNVANKSFMNEYLNQVDKIFGGYTPGLYLMSQLQVLGGDNTKYRQNNINNITSNCQRDSSFSYTLDVFYENKAEKECNDWQKECDRIFIENKLYSEGDYRILWGTFGDTNMNNVWKCYHNETNYKKLKEIKQKYDVNRIFSPNTFTF